MIGEAITTTTNAAAINAGADVDAVNVTSDNITLKDVSGRDSDDDVNYNDNNDNDKVYVIDDSNLAVADISAAATNTIIDTETNTAEEEEENIDEVGDGNGNGNGNDNNNNKDDDDDGDKQKQKQLPRVSPSPAPPVVLPQNQKELDELLLEMDGDCPYNNESKEAMNSMDTATASYVSKDVRVEPSTKLEIPIPIFVPGSIVKWKVDVAKWDIVFGIRIQNVVGTETETKKNEPEINWIVEKHTVFHHNDDDVKVIATIIDDANNVAPVKGEFIAGGASGASGAGDDSAVVDGVDTFVLEFDNVYSWMTEKMVSYSVTVSPPIDSKLIERSKRVQDWIPRIVNGILEAESRLLLSQQRTEQSKQQVSETHHRIQTIKELYKKEQTMLDNLQIDDQNFVNDRRRSFIKLETLKQIDLVHQDEKLVEVEGIIQKLQRQQSLMIQERQTILESIEDVQTTMMDCDQSCAEISRDVVQTTHEMKQISDQLKLVENDQLPQVQQIQSESYQKEQKDSQILDFLQHQIMDSLKLRLLE
mmetsp:Transcript_14414/g.16235  ORF Transcript_14414/g.16235 Transcript_14414/m.16235 type:complete len:533 (+) Transcript_14414:35-1633(+)